MLKNYGPINSKFPHFMHGGDYNPEQWIDTPGIWEEDMRLMKLSDCNTMSVGIFSWAMYEPEEGKYQFEWMDRVMDMLADNGANAVLATPSGAKPAWMALKYPQTRRIDAQGNLEPLGLRHNHCPSSEVYREKIVAINTMLAERYKNHPALLIWHLSNEYNGKGCYCDKCFAAFRNWLEDKYGNLDTLNQKWWTTFWSHRFHAWDQIINIDSGVEGMLLDWRRFTTYQMVDFMKAESEPLRRITPDVPVTTNMMGTYEDLDYWKFVPHLDVISWDSYPSWDNDGGNIGCASASAFRHDLNRTLKNGRPFMLMESTPSNVNWQSICRPKRPGMHTLSSLHAIAHGSDTIQYFQWRKSRGATEKFHGAVVDHVGHENTRVFRDVTSLSEALKKLDGVIGTTVSPQVAIIYDWENNWALAASNGPNNLNKNITQRIEMHYHEFWKRGIPVDIINADCPLDGYNLVIAPMLYQVRAAFAQEVEKFVSNGGTFIATYLSGQVDDTALCYLGGFPGPLRKLLGLWAEETDVFYPGQAQSVVPCEGNALGLNSTYKVSDYADIIHLEGADALATYGADFYKGQPALCSNNYGKGKAYYIASRNDKGFLNDFYKGVIRQHGIVSALPCVEIPEGLSVTVREDEKNRFVFLMNFADGEVSVTLKEQYTNLLDGQTISGQFCLPQYGCAVLSTK